MLLPKALSSLASPKTLTLTVSIAAAGVAFIAVKKGWFSSRRSRKDIHIKCRGPHPNYPERFHVPDNKVLWSDEFPEYKPVEFTHPVVLDNDITKKKDGWADPADPAMIDYSTRVSYEGQISFEKFGPRPLNPCGRTGLKGRGFLGKWGPNHAADPIVTRIDPVSGKLQMVAIARKDTGLWAIPGGMVDPGETVSATVRREFEEEAGNVAPEEQARLKAMLDELFNGDTKKIVYKGYVDDPRNTDNSWMETAAIHFHCSNELGAALKLNAGDDAAEVQWLTVDDNNPTYANLYASHKSFVDKAVAGIRRSSSVNL